jgi:hypothetical protein
MNSDMIVFLCHDRNTVIYETVTVHSRDKSLSLQKIYKLAEIFDLGKPRLGLIPC